MTDEGVKDICVECLRRTAYKTTPRPLSPEVAPTRVFYGCEEQQSTSRDHDKAAHIISSLPRKYRFLAIAKYRSPQSPMLFLRWLVMSMHLKQGRASEKPVRWTTYLMGG